MGNRSDSERRIEQLEYLVEKLRSDLAQARRIASQAQEDADHLQFPTDGAGAPARFQAIGAISASAGATIGTGTARMLVVLGGVRYALTDGIAGHHTEFTIYNDTFAAIADKCYGVAIMVNGLPTVIVGSYAPATTYAADDITAPGG